VFPDLAGLFTHRAVTRPLDASKNAVIKRMIDAAKGVHGLSR
jgi:hypothetical protein